jgi:CubicO group peptidase (beta-lactamase class C family)
MHRTIMRIAAVWLLASLASAPAAAAPETLADFVDTGRALWEVPGIAVAVIQGDDVTHITRGVTRSTGGERITADTTFAIASTTKAMVAAATAMLVDRGELAWNDPLARHFPELRFADGYVTEHATVLDLFTHSTGIPSTDTWTFVMDTPLHEQIARLSTVDPVAPYRVRFQYQNTMYELAGELIERVTGEPWHAFLTRELWQPLGMDTTFPYRQAAIAAGAAHVEPHHRVEGEVTPIPYFPLPADTADAAGSVWSTLNDMTRWAQFLLRGGVTADGKRLISETEFARLFEPQVLIGADDFYPTHQLTQPKWRSYGLGWFQQDYDGRRIDFHTGSLGGLCAIIGLDRDDETAVIVLENLDHAELRHAILWEVFDPARDWNGEIKTLYDGLQAKQDARREDFEAARVADTQPSHELSAYTGRYAHPTWGEFTLALEDGVLATSLPNYDVTLRHWHFDTFLLEIVPWYPPQPARFELGFDGRPTALVMGDTRYTRAEAE